MLSVCKRFYFDAAHHLPYYEGKCHNVHGHRWYLDVEVSGQVQDQGPKTGMIIDFSDLKKIVNSAVIDVLDHTDLNLKVGNPTAENMVEMFSRFIGEELFFVDCETTLERLRLYETPDAYAEWRRDV